MNESLEVFFSGEVILYDSILQNGGWVGEYKTLHLLKAVEFYKTKGGLNQWRFIKNNLKIRGSQDGMQK